MNADSLFIAGDALTGSNMYAYCNGNPVMYCDPSGMGVQEQRVVLMLLSFGFVGYIDEYLPATLFTPLLGALGDIFYVFARIDFDKAIDGLVGVYGNFVKTKLVDFGTFW